VGVNKPPSYAHYAQDWIAQTAHLSLECQGAYKRLLDHEWIGVKGWPEGVLPDNPAQLARLMGVSLRRAARIWDDIGIHFLPAEGGGLYNDRLERERVIQQGFRVAKSVSGKAGAEKRWQGHTPTHSRRHAAAIRLPMAKSVANNGSSFSSSPSTPLRKTLTTSSHEARGGPPQAVAQILGTATT
jgi:uncharacterized protein YdaU (DUF1376 family)